MDENNGVTNIFKILFTYAALMKQVKHVNQLIKFLMMGINLSLVPYVSSLFVIATAESESWAQIVMKFAAITPASVYSIRGLVLTAFLANIDFQTKVLHRSIASSIARGKVKHLYSKLLLRQIMEDLVCIRSHLMMREYTGKVTQMDVYENIIKVAQFTMLFTEFSRRFANEPLS